MSSRYVFRSQWHLTAPPDAVYDVLRDVAGYPDWWPQVRSARLIDDGAGELCCRSLLPYDLTFTISRDIEDVAARVLQARLAGDLDGTSRWTITADGSGCVATFDEDIEVHKGLVRRSGLIARPLLRFNHDLMMREGERGLRRHLQRAGRP
jgi:ribosome-associated toxin RatA of RatAB toxin-antitoxin module